MSIRCRTCKGFVPEVEIYGDWYYCDKCKRSIPILSQTESEKSQENPRKIKLEVIAQSLFDEE